MHRGPTVVSNAKFVLRFPLLYTEDVRFLQEETKMALIATVVTLASAVGAVVFSLWMLKQLFASN